MLMKRINNDKRMRLQVFSLLSIKGSYSTRIYRRWRSAGSTPITANPVGSMTDQCQAINFRCHNGHTGNQGLPPRELSGRSISDVPTPHLPGAKIRTRPYATLHSALGLRRHAVNTEKTPYVHCILGRPWGHGGAVSTKRLVTSRNLLTIKIYRYFYAA